VIPALGGNVVVGLAVAIEEFPDNCILSELMVVQKINGVDMERTLSFIAGLLDPMGHIVPIFTCYAPLVVVSPSSR
jgi:hypothetical protein